MRKNIISAFFVLAISSALLQTGCEYNPIYRIDVQQGNVVTEDALGQVELGMEKRQVRFILGTPLIQDVFHPDRWDYYYSYREGFATAKNQTVAFYFEDDELVKIEGGLAEEPFGPQYPAKREVVVVVPKERPAKTILGAIRKFFAPTDEEIKAKKTLERTISSREESLESAKVTKQEGLSGGSSSTSNDAILPP